MYLLSNDRQALDLIAISNISSEQTLSRPCPAFIRNLSLLQTIEPLEEIGNTKFTIVSLTAVKPVAGDIYLCKAQFPRGMRVLQGMGQDDLSTLKVNVHSVVQT